MIQILPCPACQRSTVLMEGVSLEATIQCPHCEEQFVVGEMLTSTFGTWTVVNDPALPHGTPQLVAASAEDDGEELRMAPLDKPQWTGTGPNRRLTRRLRGKANPNTDWSKFEPITYEQFEELRRQAGGGSAGRTMLQVGLGGLAAIPISLLLIWHVLGTDVMGAGPVVARYAPWIVPARFRPPADEEDPAVASNEPEPPKAGESGFPQFDEELGMSSSGGPPPEDLDAGRMPSTPTDLDAGGSGEPAISEVDSFEKAGETIESNRSKSLPAGSTQADVAAARPGGPPMDAASPGNDANIFEQIRQTLTNFSAWREVDELDEKQEVSQAIFQDLTQLAAALDNVPKQNPVLRKMREEMQPIGRNVQQHQELQADINTAAQGWLTSKAGAESVPLAWVVEIESVTEAEGMWDIATTAASQLRFDEQPLLVQVPRPLAPSLMAGQRLLLLGTVSRTAVASPSSGGPTPPPLREDETEASSGEPASESVDKPSTPAPQGPRFEADYLHAM